MKFSKLQKLLENNLNTEKLADIARELEVTPQVVNNWKIRDQVPYKYVQIARDKIKENFDGISHTLPEPSGRTLNGPGNDIQTFVHMIFGIHSKIKNKKRYLLFSFLCFFTLGLLYASFISKPKFESIATILPVSNSNSSSLTSFASQFGVKVGNTDVSSLADASLYPDIIKSRRLASIIIFENFNSTEYGDNTKLINILNNTPSAKSWSDFDKNIAIEKFLKKVSITKLKKSSLMNLKVQTEESSLSNQVIYSIIKNLSSLLKLFKVSEVKEKKEFINNRILEVEKTLILGEDNLRRFREQNRNISFSPALLLEEERHQRLIEVQKEIYITLKSELEMTQIDEYDNISLIQVLDEPVSLGNSSLGMIAIVIIYSLTGVILGVLLILLSGWFRENKELFKPNV